VSVVNTTVLFKALSFINGSVWACGGSVGASVSSASCALANAATGELSTQFQFPWDTITSAIVASDQSKIMVSGRTTSNGVVTSEVATCLQSSAQLACTVKSFQSVDFVKASYNAHSQQFVYVGQHANRAAVTLFGAVNNTVQSFAYSAENQASLTLSHVVSPPNFVGSFVAGTSVGSSVVAVKSIFAGWLRTDTGQMAAAIGITPVSGSIVSTAGLVNAMALEATGPDSFIAGGLELNDGAGVHAYLVRANTLYKTAQYGVRYVMRVTSNRRALSATSTVLRVTARGLALTDEALYVISDVTELVASMNRTSLSVLKVRKSDGGIFAQAQVSAPANADLRCTDITTAGLLLTIACAVQRQAATPQSLLIAVDRELSFFELPVGYLRHGNDTFQAQDVPVKATVLSVSSPSTLVSVTDSEVTTTNQAPTRRPSEAPTVHPSLSPSATPSGQPSSSPTAAPSVSQLPTSTPSTSGPTNTPKPTFAATERPTASPSAVSTARPSQLPTPQPSMAPTRGPTSTRPSAAPSSARPSAQPTMSPTMGGSSSPSVRPTRAPTARPSTSAPSTPPTPEPTVSVGGGANGRDLPAYVIGASVGGAVCFGLCGLYLLYRRRTRQALHKVAADKKGKVLLSDELTTPEYTPTPPVVSERRSSELDRYASSAESVHKSAHKSSQLRSVSVADSSSVNLSSLHTSERSFEDYTVLNKAEINRNSWDGMAKSNFSAFVESSSESELENSDSSVSTSSDNDDDFYPSTASYDETDLSCKE